MSQTGFTGRGPRHSQENEDRSRVGRRKETPLFCTEGETWAKSPRLWSLKHH